MFEVDSIKDFYFEMFETILKLQQESFKNLHCFFKDSKSLALRKFSQTKVLFCMENPTILDLDFDKSPGVHESLGITWVFLG